MCAPVALAVAGAAMQSYGQLKANQNEAAVARNNAVLAGYQRSDALLQGVEEASAIMRASDRITASGRAALGGSGIDANVGSVANLQAASAIHAAQDAARVRANAARAAWGFENEAQDHLARAKQLKEAGFLSGLAGGINTASAGFNAYNQQRGR